jgi:signal transduction histidine kinase
MIRLVAKGTSVASVSTTGRALPALSSRFRGAPAAWTFLGGGLVAIAVYAGLPASSDAQSIWYVCIGAASVAALFAGATVNLAAAERLPWLLFGFGISSQVLGDLVFAVYEVGFDREPPTPSIADVLYIAGYPLLAGGILLLVRRHGLTATRPVVLDGAVLLLGAALAQWVLFVDPYPRSSDMIYPVLDVLFLVGVVHVLLAAGGASASYRLLTVAIACWVLGDELYAMHRPGYQTNVWPDILWLASYVFWGAAALEPSVARVRRIDRRRLPRLTMPRLVVLGAALLVGPALAIFEQRRDGDVQPYVIATVTAAIALLVLLRLADVVRAGENARRAERDARREAVRAHQQLRLQNEQLVELDRMKDEFVSSITHELRTPLTSITGYVEVLRETETDEMRRNYLGIVERNSDRLLGLVSDLLFAARLQDERLELARDTIDLRMVVEHAVESARPRAEAAGVQLHADLSAVPAVVGDAARLAQLLDNLVSNAIKFTPAGGSVGVWLEAREDVVHIEVSDTGIGIAEREREHLFERFFRTQTALERQIQGSGLGLYISKAIVEAHGGRIGVESVDGEGTTFVVELPVAEGEK